MKKIQSQSTSNPCSISQAASTAALSSDQSCITVMAVAYRSRHDYLVTELSKIPGVIIQPCDGTFYTFPYIGEWIRGNKNIPDDVALTEFLLNEAHLAVVPGSAFGAPGYIRISYATQMEKIQEAIVRLKKAIEQLQNT